MRHPEQSNVIVLDRGGKLPRRSRPARKVRQRKALGRELLRFVGAAKGLPADMARNHDHYLHGQPRK